MGIDASKHAVEALADALPGVDLVPIPADDMIALEGVLHCLALNLSRPPPKQVDRARRVPTKTVP